MPGLTVTRPRAARATGPAAALQERPAEDTHLHGPVIAKLLPGENHAQLVSRNPLSLSNHLLELKDAGGGLDLHREAVAGVEPHEHWRREWETAR